MTVSEKGAIILSLPIISIMLGTLIVGCKRPPRCKIPVRIIPGTCTDAFLSSEKMFLQNSYGN